MEETTKITVELAKVAMHWLFERTSPRDLMEYVTLRYAEKGEEVPDAARLDELNVDTWEELLAKYEIDIDSMFDIMVEDFSDEDSNEDEVSE